ncbi:MAG: hypothetical protein U9R06_04080 [Patescibacteria group bacterium]|nr:hypothetical protein [Patescibacteria group bacterium]
MQNIVKSGVSASEKLFSEDFKQKIKIKSEIKEDGEASMEMKRIAGKEIKNFVI